MAMRMKRSRRRIARAALFAMLGSAFACDDPLDARIAPADAGQEMRAPEPISAVPARAPHGELAAPPRLQTRADGEIDAAGATIALDPGAADLDELIWRLGNARDAAVREAAAVALAYATDGRAVDALIAATEDSEARVAVAAIETLAISDDSRAVATLEAIARADDAVLAAAAARARPVR
jgi:HEAT repeat protein